MTAVLDHVAIGVTIAVRIRRERRPAEQADLTAVGMAGERKGEAVGQIGENLGFVREQDGGLVRPQRRQRRVEVGRGPLAVFVLVRTVLVAETGEPESSAVMN